MSSLLLYIKRWDLVLLTAIIYFFDLKSQHLNYITGWPSLVYHLYNVIFYFLFLHIFEGLLIDLNIRIAVSCRLLIYGSISFLLTSQVTYFQIFNKKYDYLAIRNVIENLDYWLLFFSENADAIFFILSIALTAILTATSTFITNSIYHQNPVDGRHKIVMALIVFLLLGWGAVINPNRSNVVILLTGSTLNAGLSIVKSKREVSTKSRPEMKSSMDKSSIYNFGNIQPPNLLVILLESVRYDYFETFVWQGISESIKHQSIFYEHAYATTPSTILAVNDMFGYGFNCIDCESSVIEHVRKSGIYTAYYSSHWNGWNAAGVTTFREEDFDYFSAADNPNIKIGRDDEETLRHAMQGIRDHDEKTAYFMIVHLNDTHFPYDESCNGFVKSNDTVQCYEISMVNLLKRLRDFLHNLQSLKLLDNTVLIITSDHGESFGENGYHFHGTTLQQEQIHIPLTMYLPERFLQTLSDTAIENLFAKSDRPISAMDIAPTISNIYMLSDGNYFGESLFRWNKSKRIISYLPDGSISAIDRMTGCKIYKDNYLVITTLNSIYPDHKARVDYCNTTYEMENVNLRTTGYSKTNKR